MYRWVVLWRLLRSELIIPASRSLGTVSPTLFIYALVALLFAAFARRTLRIRALKQYRAKDVDTLLQSHGAVVFLDVRSDAERAEGAIKPSIHIPLQLLRARIDELTRYKDREIVCYCRGGSRSVSAALLLQKHGFRVANLQGGIAVWNFLRR